MTGVGRVAQTVDTTAGRKYGLSLWVTANDIEPANSLSYMLDGGPAVFIPRIGALGTFDFFSDMFAAIGASAEIKFLFETDPGTGGFFIDDVPVSAAPLPAALALVAAALGGLVLERRKQAA
jgi:hypothetical protein